jgi:hypothetical protein
LQEARGESGNRQQGAAEAEEERCEQGWLLECCKSAWWGGGAASCKLSKTLIVCA